MALALILSSFVAASRIGGAAQQCVLAAHRIDPVLAPTAMFGRTPARGGTGEVTPPAVFRRILGDIEADAVFGLVDLILTGHFSDPEQVEIAAGLIERARSEKADGRPIIVVDPVLGDAPKGLYVKAAVAEAVAARLVPLADWITPNRWELERLSGRAITTTIEARDAARRLGRPALVTSAPAGEGETGVLYVDEGAATLFAHPRIDGAPNGTGDLFSASFAAGLIERLTPVAAAARATRAAAEAVAAARSWKIDELPIVAIADRIVRPEAVLREETL